MRLHQSWVVRMFHGLNLLAVWAMVGSGLQIYSANPVFGGRSGTPAPAALQIGGWLAGGRHWHFFFMWVFALNLMGYGVFLFTSDRWRKRYPGVKDLKAMLQGPQAKYAWHRITFTLLVLTLLFSLYTGLGMYKPVQLHWIVASFGGDWQALRVAHFLPVVILLVLTAGHVWQGFRVGGWPLLQSIFFDAYPNPQRPTSKSEP